MNILSLDASTHSTGWAYYENGQLKDYGCITATSADLIKRIQKVTQELQKVLNKYPNVEQVILEEVLPEGKNLKTHKALIWLQAAINFLLHDYNSKVKIEYVYPSEWRATCGIKQGRGVKRTSLKEADMQFVKDKFGITANDDICDAIAIGWAYQNKKPVKYAW